MRRYLSWMVRGYLRRCPVTDGKRHLLALTRNWIMPQEKSVVFKTKYSFQLKANLANPEHQYLYFYGTHDERYAIGKLRRILKQGDVCWDIGANIGFYTCLFASCIGNSGAVVAFEPAAQTCGYLRENVLLNQFSNVTVVNKAIGDRKEQRLLYYSDAVLAEGTASLKYMKEPGSSESIELDTIDHLVPKLPLPNFIKIDVEGYQLEVLRGGEHYFKTDRPLVMAELRDVGEMNSDTFEKIEQYLASLGYSLYEIRKHSLRRCFHISETCGRNFFLVNEGSPLFDRISSFVK